MKLYEVANFIKRVINIAVILFLVISGYISAVPFITEVVTQTKQATQKEVIPYTLNPINFTQDPTLKYDLTNTQVLYIGNPETQWSSLENKKAKVYEYNVSKNIDIDYLPTARRIALNLGYDDSNITDNGDLSNKYIWAKNSLQFEIDKISKRMTQMPQTSDLANIKKYVTAGNFLSNEVAQNYGLAFLNSSGRFSKIEIESLIYEPFFLRFESNLLVETNNISSELCYLKIYRKLNNLKVVSKRYDFPQIYFYVSSIRPDIEASFKNYRYPMFKINKIDYKLSYNDYDFDLNNLTNVVNNQIKTKNFVISEIKINNSNFGYIPNKDTSKIKTISIESFEVGYYDNYEDTGINKNIQPIYIFKGSVEMGSGEKGRITMYVPALDPKYYSVSK